MLARKLYYLQRVERQQWMKPAELQRLQDEKLRAMIRHAFRFVPYYRRVWKGIHITPDDIKTVEDLEKLPTIGKNDVLKNFDDMIASNYRNAYRSNKIVTKRSSGSSGTPFKMVFDSRAWDYLDAVYLRALMAVGYDPRKPLAYYWYEPLPKKIYNYFGFMRKTYIPFTLSEEEQMEVLKSLNPEYVYYFPSTLHCISKKMLEEGARIRPKMIVTHAELLSEGMRRRIEDAFGCDVHDQYGMSEFNRIAWECGAGNGYHIDADSVVLQTSEDENTNRGEAVVTGLANYILPLIRYKTGDSVELTDEECSCGRGLPMLKSIRGRLRDMVALKSGRIVKPKYLVDACEGVDGLEKFKVVYHGHNRFSVQIVARDAESASSELERKLKRLIGERSSVKIEAVEDIPVGDLGKRKMVEVSKR